MLRQQWCDESITFIYIFDYANDCLENNDGMYVCDGLNDCLDASNVIILCWTYMLLIVKQ